VLGGMDGQAVAYLLPLDADPERAAWYGEQLRALDPLDQGGRKLWFCRVALFHLGPQEAGDLVLDPLELSVVEGGGWRHSVPLPNADATPRVRASVLPFKALEGYLGRRLPPGHSFTAITAFEQPLELSGVEAGTLVAGRQAIALRPVHLDHEQFSRLLEFPAREDVLIGLAVEVPDGQAARSIGNEGD